MKHILILFLLVSCFVSAQDDSQPKGSFQAQLTLPNTASNRAFNDIMQGLVNIHTGYQYTIDNGVSFGAGLKMTYLTINEFKTLDKLQGGILLTGPYGKVGYERFYGDFGLDLGLKVGYSLNFSSNTNCLEKLGGSYNFDSGFLEPEIGLVLKASDNSSFRLSISHAIYGFEFMPHMFCQENFLGFDDFNLERSSQIFSIGFGYSFYFGMK